MPSVAHVSNVAYGPVIFKFLCLSWTIFGFFRLSPLREQLQKKQDPSFCSFELKIKYAIGELQS